MLDFPLFVDKKIADENFNWVLTIFIFFELERETTTFPKTEIDRIDRLIQFHEGLENYEICCKLLTYKEKIKHV